jgi:hypothetical protein
MTLMVSRNFSYQEMIPMKATRTALVSAVVVTLLMGLSVAQADTGSNPAPAANPPAVPGSAPAPAPSHKHKHKHKRHGKKHHR